MDLEFIRLPQRDLKSGRVAVESVFWFTPEEWEVAKDALLACYDGEHPNQTKLRVTLLQMFERAATPLDLRPRIKLPPVEKIDRETFRQILKR